uniref:NADH-ubiquinone oxidoreductase chain 2 n=1 Tax=Gregariella coralliophaga TaxID=2590089 RepID=A0A516EZG3_9BIVA|nr:NADH dehydrogenase subunit 2 [Gregariella coralliophaga]QDO71896.1 NADH dehydrogenase subunit 2 [Gregariella coralliophaga]
MFFSLLSPMMMLSGFAVFFGAIISVSSMSWVGLWVGMELNLFGFLIFMNFDGVSVPEPCVKYFIVQSTGSMFLVMGFLGVESFASVMTMFLIVSGATLKAGVFPFHSWVPLVVKNSSWMSSSLILTWQKLAPLMAMAIVMSKIFLSILVFFMALIGGIGGLNQLSIRLMSAYSSFVHTSWMLASLLNSLVVFVFYFFIYMLSVLCLFWCCAKINKYSVVSSGFSASASVCLIMLSGVPPFLGFLGKILVFLSVMSMEIFPCIIGSVISLKFYLSFFYSMVMSSSHSDYLSGAEKIITTLVVINVVGLMVVFMIF